MLQLVSQECCVASLDMMLRVLLSAFATYYYQLLQRITISSCNVLLSEYKKIGVLPIRIVWSNVSSIGSKHDRNEHWLEHARNVRPYYPYWQYFSIIFRFVSLLCLRSTLRVLLSALATYYYQLLQRIIISSCNYYRIIVVARIITSSSNCCNVLRERVLSNTCATLCSICNETLLRHKLKQFVVRITSP